MKVTEKCSFGVVLLELVTGRSPVQPLEQGGDLVTCVRRAIQASESPLDEDDGISSKVQIMQLKKFICGGTA
ncbi:hypothetical protein AAZX31_14G130600 [Glycine max]